MWGRSIRGCMTSACLPSVQLQRPSVSPQAAVAARARASPHNRIPICTALATHSLQRLLCTVVSVPSVVADLRVAIGTGVPCEPLDVQRQPPSASAELMRIIVHCHHL
ncbi:hypothetical protein HBI25_202250 [Parastagonospora nodorum]|nr:hypothetical protein HBI25_202250 [Parastagonospora nodorum]